MAYLAITGIIIGACLFAVGAAFVVIIRRRHDRTVRQIFWGIGTWFMLGGVNRVAALLRNEIGTETFVAISAVIQGLTALVGVAIVGWLLVWIPKIMAIPNVDQLYKVNQLLQADVTHLKKQLKELRDLPEGDIELIVKAFRRLIS